ncbi:MULTISPECIES: AMIN domain-containing protein [Campylobacter]|uniref:AMIN domain-containing protein n=1 Tax=Campylobacter TaxID=194 RepID=UPI000A3577DF|nr:MULTISPECIES: AMIN domain-containing protein [unclassified Campylobacter]MCR8697075.1 AMIN domain-containing protein [Campylobacter sp. RM19073]MEE3705342.1 AMIN domain-containing protein [Campylobacter sp. CX2-8023-23]MEE3776670.1 AMIN domain-containing protein [Campylobacter sp. CX2-4080-23]
MKKIILIASCAIALLARENPFVPDDINVTTLDSTNVSENAPKLDRVIAKFPSDARELVSATFSYKSIDGSIKQKIVDINASFDWHDDIIISSQSPVTTQATPALDVSVTTTDEQTKQAVAKQAAPKPLSVPPKIEPPLKSVSFMDFIKFDIFNSKIEIISSDEMIRDFIINKPDKIVMDFSRSSDFTTKTIKIDKGPLKKATIGAHKGYYRVVLFLDGNYHYAIRQSGNGYTLTLR